MRATRGRVRRTVVVAMALAVAFAGLAGPASAPAEASGGAAAAEADMVSRIAAERQARGLPGLRVETTLTEVARDWTRRMIADGELSHRPMSELAGLVRDDWQRLAENVGFSLLPGAEDHELITRLHDAFMNSPGHRDNVLGDFTHVGVGVDHGADGALWITVNFMKAPVSSPAPAPPPPPAVDAQVNEAVAVSRQLFADAGRPGRTADFAVVARGEVFADALGGASLAGTHAPVLFTVGPSAADADPTLDPRTRAELDRVLGRHGRVYLLGGEHAVSGRVQRELEGAGYDVRRVAGASRVETSVAVAEEVVRRHGRPDAVLLARADEWPDAVTAGAYGAATATPVLLTDGDSLHPAVQAFLQRHRPAHRWALGGRSALDDAVVAAAGATRIAGAERTETSVAIALRLWGRTSASAGDRFVATPSHGEGAWAFALAQAPLAAAHGAPQLLVGDTVPAAVATYLQALDYAPDEAGTLHTASSVDGDVVRALERLLGY